MSTRLIGLPISFHSFGSLSFTSLDRKSTRLNSSHTEIYTLSLHDALPIFDAVALPSHHRVGDVNALDRLADQLPLLRVLELHLLRSEEHTSELQSHRDLHSFPTRRSSDLRCRSAAVPSPCRGCQRA